MAEVRKFRQGNGGHIAQAIARALGESVRPITPGGSPDPSKTNEASPPASAVTAASFAVSDAFLVPAAEENQPAGDEKGSGPEGRT